ncbi:hypothetical protein CALVIDRAFT_569804 [Calocera viscosa TUFC12733]|uniref:Uncharacterized protein n=1 Tax=Calocera viscosa (strain TUFC12733) TaxID=1330018 RepID=A0A167FK19_CALVF|nr:hypothetical protein CALVIDRAFT_569804 [Calocera viscosa TUFC12733]
MDMGDGRMGGGGMGMGLSLLGGLADGMLLGDMIADAGHGGRFGGGDAAPQEEPRGAAVAHGPGGGAINKVLPAQEILVKTKAKL